MVVYFDPKLAAVVLVSDSDNLLFVRRAIEPMLGRWSFPSGYVDRGEAVEHAAVREVREETNLDVETTGLLGVYSSNGSPVALVAYAARVTGGVLRAGDEAQDARFFPVDALPELPFPHDDQILKDWRKKKQLKNQQT
ncbi:MAG: DNA mismatch repair protein MutT [Dehalococcoidia bacterium]|nr:DNA mismatch repair protein MutT [Dehalococcoidia bacterium]